MTNASTTAGGPGTAGAPPPPRRLQRRTDDKMVAGVAAGLADHFGVDVTLVRLGVVLLALTGPGVVAYLVAWLIMPAAPPGAPANPNRAGPGLSGGQAVAGAILLAIGAIALFDDWWWWDDGFLFPLALLAVGAVLLLRQRPDDPPAAGPGSGGGAIGPDGPGPGSGPDEPGGSGGPAPDAPPTGPGTTPPVPGGGLEPWSPTTAPLARLDDPTLGGPAVGDATLVDPLVDDPTAVPPPSTGGGAAVPGPGGGFGPAPAWPPPRSRRRERSALGGVVVGVGLVAAGVGWFLAATDVIEPDAGDVLAGILVILGLGLVAGAWWGRARWLALLAVPVAGALVAVALIGDGSLLSGPWGDRAYRPTSVAEVQDTYRLGAGELLIDLSGLELRAGRSLEVDASVGAGSLRVVVPDGAAVVVDASVRGGQILLPGDEAVEGWRVDERWVSDGATAGAGRLELDLEATFGEVEVERG